MGFWWALPTRQYLEFYGYATQAIKYHIIYDSYIIYTFSIIDDIGFCSNLRKFVIFIN